MNTIEFSLSGNVPDLMIKIDGIDVLSMNEFKGNFIPTAVPSFLFNEYMWSQSETDDVYNGTMLIATCSCGCQGCDDLIVKISSNTKTTKWTIIQDRDRKMKKAFSFSAKDYKEQIEKLTEKYFNYSWETKADKIRRLCTEYIRTFQSRDGYNIEGVKINPILDDDKKITADLSNVIEIYYYSDWEPCDEGIVTPYHNWEIKFDGQTLESAMKALKKFAVKNLVKNNNEVSLRPKCFRLVYTKDKSKVEEILNRYDRASHGKKYP